MVHDPLTNCIWQALETSHRPLGIFHGAARRYPSAVAPFAAVENHSPKAMDDLASLLAPSESVYLLGERPPYVPGLQWDGIVACLQMVLPALAPPPHEVPGAAIEPLGCGNAHEMLALINIAFPGYFRPETCRMGRYYGIRDSHGRLVAMGGERLVLGPWREVSGLCSHPEQAGRGLGTIVLRHILAVHRAEGSISWLHVSETNTKAIALYERLGLQTLRRIELHRMKRIE